jgi:hypothetical protein
MPSAHPSKQRVPKRHPQIQRVSQGLISIRIVHQNHRIPNSVRLVLGLFSCQAIRKHCKSHDWGPCADIRHIWPFALDFFCGQERHRIRIYIFFSFIHLLRRSCLSKVTMSFALIIVAQSNEKVVTISPINPDIFDLVEYNFNCSNQRK